MADTDLIDQLIKSAPWMVIPATLLTAAPKILDFWHGFSSTRDGRKQLEIEKTRLENLKLRIEIEALKRQHGIILDEENDGGAQSSPSFRTVRQHEAWTRKKAAEKPWSWLSRFALRRPRLAPAVIGGFSVVFVWLGVFTLLTFIAVGLTTWFTDVREEFGYFLLGGAISLLLPAVLLLRIGLSLRTQRRLMDEKANLPAGRT